MSETQPLQLRDPSPMTVIANAIQAGNVSVETLKGLMDLQERAQAQQARMEFLAAMSAFQAECPSIERNRDVNAGKFGYKYAELDYIADIIRPLLQKHGLSYRFDSEQTDNRITVTCRVSHAAGHSESSKFTSPTGGTSAMSAMQQTASGLSYARRYALQLALGLTTRGEDNDAAPPPAPVQTITPEQADALAAMIEESGVAGLKERVLKYGQVEKYADFPANLYAETISGIRKAIAAKGSAK